MPCPLVIVHNLDIVRTIVLPHETDKPLFIDTNAVLTAPITPELFQLITGRHPQSIQLHRSLHHQQLASGYPFNILEARNHMTEKQALGIGTGK